eukprot:1358811-Pyramimonas_sp.AAC.1
MCGAMYEMRKRPRAATGGRRRAGMAATGGDGDERRRAARRRFCVEGSEVVGASKNSYVQAQVW